jgi:hypothetical protein
MQIERSKFNEMIVKDVMSGNFPAYHNSKNGIDCWSLYKGLKGPYNHNQTDPRVTIVLHRPHSSTYRTLSCDYREVAEYITNHEYNFESFIQSDNKLADYLSSDDGKWGRQDEF